MRQQKKIFYVMVSSLIWELKKYFMTTSLKKQEKFSTRTIFL